MKKFQFFSLVIIIVIISQSCMTPKRALKKAHTYYDMGEYYKAVPKFKKARRLKLKAEKAETNFFLGECYNNLLEYKRASAYYNISSKYLYSDSIVFLRLAQMQQINEEYDKARTNYKIYLEHAPNNETALKGIIACNTMDTLKIPSEYVVKPLTILNSYKSDYSPMFLGSKNNAIYFTSTRDVKNDKKKKRSDITGSNTADIYFSRLNVQGDWTKPENLGGGINTSADEGTTSFNEGGTEMYFSRSIHEGTDSIRTMIMVSNRTGAKWSNPSIVELVPDSVLISHPSLSPDGNTLYFVSDMPGGEGGKDIWCVYRNKDKKWGLPKNLGPKINTAGDEMFPYARKNNQLYFSSNGREGIGGLDIYCADLDVFDEWNITHLPSPINSNKDDFGICYESEEDKGFFSSNRSSSKGYDNIFSFEIPSYKLKITGIITDSKTKEPMNFAKVQFVGNDGINSSPEIRPNGSFRETLIPDHRYQFLVTSPGYLSQRIEFNTDGINVDKEYNFSISMASIDRPVPLNNVFYDFGSWELKSEGKLSLDSLAMTLNDNPNIAIEISSHTDAVGSDSANLVLSQKRAEGVVNYLIESGIDSARLSAVGYGESKPVEVTPNLLEKYIFLRPGDILDENLLKILPKRQRLIVDQINRRTEFSITSTSYHSKKTVKRK